MLRARGMAALQMSLLDIHIITRARTGERWSRAGGLRAGPADQNQASGAGAARRAGQAGSRKHSRQEGGSWKRTPRATSIRSTGGQVHIDTCRGAGKIVLAPDSSNETLHFAVHYASSPRCTAPGRATHGATFADDLVSPGINETRKVRYMPPWRSHFRWGWAFAI